MKWRSSDQQGTGYRVQTEPQGQKRKRTGQTSARSSFYTRYPAPAVITRRGGSSGIT